MHRVVIVEDQPMVCMINKKFTQQDPRFTVVRTFDNGQQALPWLLSNQVDLLILDVYMPVLSGLELLRALRTRGSQVDVIMVTAAHEVDTLEALRKLGITDYLVKPFTRERFQQALDSYCARRQALSGRETVSQSDIDRLLFSPAPESAAPKGLQERTMQRLRDALGSGSGAALTCEELSAQVGLSTVTVRRYVSYLAQLGEVESRMNYDTGGRPCMTYRWIKK